MATTVEVLFLFHEFPGNKNGVLTNMKTTSLKVTVLAWLFFLIPAHAQNGGCCDQGYPDAGSIADYDIDGDGVIDILYLLFIPPSNDPTFHILYYELYASPHSAMLTPNQKSTFYNYGANIFRPTSQYIDIINPTDYGAYNGPGGWQYGYANDAFSGNKLTNVYVGFVLTQSDGNHYGWLHMSRPDLKVKTPFAVVDYAYNPVPDAPIQAGIPAPPPVISTQKTSAGIQLAWPASISGWTLQTTTELGSNPVWQDYSTGTTNLLVSPTETRRYFRLVKP